MEKTRIRNWEDLVKSQVCYRMSAENIQKLEDALANPTHSVVRVLDLIADGDHAPMVRGTFIVDGQGYSFISIDLSAWRYQDYSFNTLTAGNIMISRIFGESLDSDFLMQMGKFINDFDTLAVHIQYHWFDSININDIEYKDGRAYFGKLVGDIL